MAPLAAFKENFKQHQHKPWRKFYIDCGAVLDDVAAREPGGGGALALQDASGDGSATALRLEADRALSFAEARKQELGESIDRLKQELDTLAASERTARTYTRNHRTSITKGDL